MLRKGLTFIPTPKLLPISHILENKNKLIRNIKIKCAFSHKIDNNFDNKKKLFIEKSKWTPSNTQLFRNDSLATALDIINKIETCTNNIIKSHETCEKYSQEFVILKEKLNLTSKEFSAINKLKNNTNLTIKPADKGGSLVLMQTEHYLYEAQRQLNDKNYYKKLTRPIYPDNKIKIHNILTRMYRDGFISDKQLQYLSGPTDPRPRRFYILPKIHKKPDTWTIPNKMPQGRPIVSDINSESYRISEYVESFLQPLACKHASYIKNSQDFIEKIKNYSINKNTYLVTGDVTSLYTNMKHNFTISSIEKVFNKYPDLNRPSNYIVELLKLILENNDFEFNDEIYLQTCGCPMGKVIGPSAANIYLLDFDEAAMSGFAVKPLLFFRYLDDVFFLWNDSLDKLKEYETFLNNLIPGITITLEASLISANFLDITIYKKQYDNLCTLATKIFVKPTDTQNLLHTLSFHPKHTTKGILKSQLIRYKRISSTWEDYIGAARTLFHNLGNRGYSWSHMWNQLKDIWFNYIDNYDKTNKSNNIFPIVINYDKVGMELGRQYKSILSNCGIFNNFKPILAYKNHRNLNKMLIRSIVCNKNNINQVFFSKKCTKTNCKACNHIVECSTFYSNHNSNKIYKIKHNFTCKTRNIIYLITCNKCRKQYVGQSSRPLADRINNHLSCIRTHKQTPISIHFNLPNHSINDLKIHAIDHITTNYNISDLLNTKETYWQNTLMTMFPHGLNHQNDNYL